MTNLETARLILRPFEERDYDDLYEFLSQRREAAFESYPGITYENGPIHIQREYSHTEKMRAILHYLRWIDPYGTPEEDPEAAEGSLYKIIVRCANGTEKVYLQKADRFMRIGGGQWLKINPNNALTLSKMIGEMDSDEV